MINGPMPKFTPCIPGVIQNMEFLHRFFTNVHKDIYQISTLGNTIRLSLLHASMQSLRDLSHLVIDVFQMCDAPDLRINQAFFTITD